MEDDEDLHVAKAGQFYGVYILYNINPKHKGKVYIGFTVNPVRRIRQHNREIKGGAWKTGGERGPWDMVLIVHGFSSRLAALQFEWAWQKPTVSLRLKHVKKKERKELIFSYRMRVLSEMLNTGPWNRLPLVIRWLKQEYQQNFSIEKQPPNHMAIAYGPLTVASSSSKSSVTSKSPTKSMVSNSQEVISCGMVCSLCGVASQTFDTKGATLKCVIPSCNMRAHMICLAQEFLKQSKELESCIIPISGSCPKCHHDVLWNELVRKRSSTMCRDKGASNSDSENDNDIDADNCIGSSQTQDSSSSGGHSDCEAEI